MEKDQMVRERTTNDLGHIEEIVKYQGRIQHINVRWMDGFLTQESIEDLIFL